MIGILLSEIPASERNSSGTKYRRVGTGEIHLTNGSPDEGELRGAAVDGLAWYMANHLERQGCVATVVIV